MASSAFNHPLDGNTSISPKMVIRLSEVLGSSAENWLAIQENFNPRGVRIFLQETRH
jgi:plasmid maintenance system antidote protein VapI